MNADWKRQGEHCIKKNHQENSETTNMRGSGGACENVFKVETPACTITNTNEL